MTVILQREKSENKVSVYRCLLFFQMESIHEVSRPYLESVNGRKNRRVDGQADTKMRSNFSLERTDADTNMLSNFLKVGSIMKALE